MRRHADLPDPRPGSAALAARPGAAVAGSPARREPTVNTRPGTPLRVGVAGRGGSGKTALIAALCRVMGERMSVAVVTNDVSTPRDAEALRSSGAIPAERVAPVLVGRAGATDRYDLDANFEAVDDLVARLFPLDLVLVEAAGDDLVASFGEELVDLRILVVEATRSDQLLLAADRGVGVADLLVVTKADLARREGVPPARIEAAVHRVRGDAPVVVLSLPEDPGAVPVVTWLLEQAARWRTGAPVPA